MAREVGLVVCVFTLAAACDCPGAQRERAEAPPLPAAALRVDPWPRGLAAEQRAREVEELPPVQVLRPTLEFKPNEHEPGERIDLHLPISRRTKESRVDDDAWLIGRLACLIGDLRRVEIVDTCFDLHQYARHNHRVSAFVLSGALKQRPSECTLELYYGSRLFGAKDQRRARRAQEEMKPFPQVFRWRELGGEPPSPSRAAPASTPLRPIKLRATIVLEERPREQERMFTLIGDAWVERGATAPDAPELLLEGSCRLSNGETIDDSTQLVRDLWTLEPGDVGSAPWIMFFTEELPGGVECSSCELRWRPHAAAPVSGVFCVKPTETQTVATPGPCA